LRILYQLICEKFNPKLEDLPRPYNFSLSDQIVKELERVAKVPIAQGRPCCLDSKDPTLPWRYPLRYCTRQAGAAFVLFQQHFVGLNDHRSLEKATYWLKLSAECGYPLAMALCAQFNKRFNIGLEEEIEVLWLEQAAKNGSQPALRLLKSKHPEKYEACLNWYRTHFWLYCHEISDADVDNHFSYGLSTVQPSWRTGKYHDSPLHCAAMCGSVENVKRLLNSNSGQVNQTNDLGQTPLFLAYRSGNVTIIDFLLDRGADAKVSTNLGESGLHWLKSFDDDSVFPYAWKLLERGVDLHQEAKIDESFAELTARRYFYGNAAGSPLHTATNSGSEHAIQVLLNLGADSRQQSDGFTPLCRAASLHRIGLLRMMLQYPLSVDINAGLTTRCGQYSVSTLNRTITPRYDDVLLHYVNEDYSDATAEAAMRLLVENGADVRNAPYDMLYLAVTRRNSVATDLVLKNGYPDVNKMFCPIGNTRMNGTALHIAAVNKDFDMIEVLVRHGADINAKATWYGDTASLSALLLCARDFASPRLIQRLLDLGADVNAFDHLSSHGDTALTKCLASNNFLLSNLLIENGASISYEPPVLMPSNGLKALMSSLISGLSLYRSLEFLINHPVEDLPFWVSRTLRITIFHNFFTLKEISRRNIDLAQVRAIIGLIRRKFPGVDALNVTDVFGRTALHCAVYYANADGVEVLLECGCNKFTVVSREETERKVLSLLRIEDSSADEDDVRESIHYMEPYLGKSAMNMAREGIFIEIPQFIKDLPEAYEEFMERRHKIKTMFGLVPRN
jgi:ankyrin repeat protein